MNRSTSSGRSSAEELPDQVDRVREPLRDLDPHLAPIEHALDLGHELADQRLAPRRPRRRAGGERVGLREQVQRREPFRRLDPRGDVQDQVVVAEIASGGGVGQEQVLGHHEPSELARRRLDIHAGEDRGRDPVADQHVPALPVLADVVQERPEERAVPFLDVTGRHDLERIVRVGLGEGAGHPVERPQQVHVDRVSVVRVALRATAHVDPFGDQTREQTGSIERLQSVRRPRSRAEDAQERVAHRIAPLELIR